MCLKQLPSLVGEVFRLIDALPQGFLHVLDFFDLLIW